MEANAAEHGQDPHHAHWQSSADPAPRNTGAREGGRGDVDRPALDTLVMRSVAEVVAQQCGVGVDVINDGEQGKVAYAIYVKDRLSGFEDWDAPKPAARRDDFPEYTERMAREQRTIVSSDIKLPVCTGPIAYTNVAAIQTDLDNLKNALTAVSPTDVS